MCHLFLAGISGLSLPPSPTISPAWSLVDFVSVSLDPDRCAVHDGKSAKAVFKAFFNNQV